MAWKLTALLLLLPTWWWLVTVLPPLFSVVDFAEHMVEEGEHCDDFCSHPSSPIDPPQATTLFNILDVGPVFHERIIALLPLDHAARDRPPPLFYSLSHSLRAPPTLIPA